MRKTISILILAVMAMGTVSAQTADEIARKYVEAIGGAKKWKALKSRKMTFDLSMQGITLSGTMVGDAKGRERTDISFNGMNIIQAYDGTNAWAVSPPEGITTPTKLSGPQAEALADVEFLDEFIDYKSRGFAITLEGEETFGDKTYHKIKLVKKEGKEEFYFFDKETNLLKVKRETGLQGLTDTHYSDYQDVDGLKVPMKFEVKSGGATMQSISVKNVELNVEAKDDFFAFPGK